MYNNVGKKIQSIAQVIGWISLISGLFAWIILITNGYDGWYGYEYITEDDYIAWVALISGILGFMSSWFTYGFGQLVEDIHVLRNQQAQPTSSVNDDLPEL